MPIPSESKILPALIEELEKAGGVGKPQDLIGKLAQRFGVTLAERNLRAPSGHKVFNGRVYWAASTARLEQGLIEPVEKSGRGIWIRTSKQAPTIEDLKPDLRNLASTGEVSEKVKPRENLEQELDALRSSLERAISQFENVRRVVLKEIVSGTWNTLSESEGGLFTSLQRLGIFLIKELDEIGNALKATQSRRAKRILHAGVLQSYIDLLMKSAA